MDSSESLAPTPRASMTVLVARSDSSPHSVTRRSMMHSTRTLATAPTLRAPLARRGRRLPSCSARHRRSRVVVASFGLVLPGDDAFERLRPTRDDDDDEDRRPRRRRRSERGRALARTDATRTRTRGAVASHGEVRAEARRGTRCTRARGIGVEAGVSSERFEVCSGYIGGRESALEMRVGGFAGLGEVEAFLRGVPRDEQRSGEGVGEYGVDGTPEWDIMEVWGVEEGDAGGGSGMVPRSSSVEAVKAVETDSPAATARTTFEDEIDESLLIPGTTLPDGRKVVADWKGDPMVLNPGDRMPRF